MPAQRKTTKKKVVTSSNKKTNGFIHRLNAIPLFGKLLISIVLLAGVTYGGWYGYNSYKANDLKAKAGGWSPYSKNFNVGTWACQYRSNTGAPGVKVLAIDRKSKAEVILDIGKNFANDPKGHNSYNGEILRRTSNNSAYWGGISGIQLSHSQATSFYVWVPSSSTNGDAMRRLFWSYQIAHLAWC